MKKVFLILIALAFTSAAANLSSDSNGLVAELELSNTHVKSLADMSVTIKLQNVSGQDLIQFHNLKNLEQYIKIRESSGKPLANQSDKGEDEQAITVTGVTRISPGQSLSYNYFGLPSPLPPGDYQAQFVFSNTDGGNGDWVGEVKSKWVDFTVLPQ